ncbi:MAG: protein kinase [Acidobacteria bacterium]|nr:protein kinase [Acidobacteriota bacterium]
MVKVLDFGLAKAVERASGASGADSPTLTMRATEVGLILGTAGYMSPEQAAGKAVDRRADIWAFGVVLYELITGKRLFDGETVTHTLADVLRAPIDLTVIGDGQVCDLIARCLDRNVRSRLAHIAEARIAIEKYAPARAVAPAKAGWWPWATAGVLAVALLVAGIGWYTATRPGPPRPLIQLDMDIPPGTPLARVDRAGGSPGNMLALSPDGSRVALSLRGADGKVRLQTRLLHQSQVTPLAGTEDAHAPFFSPAGDWIGFFADGKMKKIAAEGGAVVTLCDAPRGYGGSWGDDGNIIAALDNKSVLSQVPSVGGTPVPVTKLNAGEVTHRWPQVLPGSQAVLFTAAAQTGAGYDDANIEVISLRTGERKTLQRGGFSARYLTDTTGSAIPGSSPKLRSADRTIDRCARYRKRTIHLEITPEQFPGWIALARRHSRCTPRRADTSRRASRPTASGWRLRWTAEKDETSGLRT